MRLLLPLAGALLLLCPLAAQPTSRYSATDLERSRTMLADVAQAVSDDYYPNKRIGDEFDQRIAEAKRNLAKAHSQNEANAIIADALAWLDPRIRLYPPLRSVRIDYGWDWRIIGSEAFVTHLDSDGAARKLGLLVGDRILSVEGIELNRAAAQDFYYAFYTLAPRPGLRVVAQSPGSAPRELAIPATLRPQHKFHETISGWKREQTPLEHQRLQEHLDPQRHLRRVGPVAVWRAEELDLRISDVSEGLKSLHGAESLVLDLRNLHILRHETAVRLLEGLLPQNTDVGRIAKDHGRSTSLRVSADRDPFGGTILVLVDSTTVMYAELVARVLQQQHRAVIIGDRTMGRCYELQSVSYARGMAMGFDVSAVSMPIGEVVLTDGYPLDERGVVPDFLLLPKPADLAAHRDPVLANALSMLKQNVTPEEAYAYFRNEPDDEETP